MSQFTIKGGAQLRGNIEIYGAKNSALPIIAASILVGEAKLNNVPHIRDVEVMLEILSFLGGKFEWRTEHELYIDTRNVEPKPLNDMAPKIMGPIAFRGPMLAPVGKVELPFPGGDITGARPLDTHINSFRELGAQVEVGEILKFTIDKSQGANFILDEPSVLGTENVITYASGI